MVVGGGGGVVHTFNFNQSPFPFVTSESIVPAIEMPSGPHHVGTNLTLTCIVLASRVTLEWINKIPWVGHPDCVNVHSV